MLPRAVAFDDTRTAHSHAGRRKRSYALSIDKGAVPELEAEETPHLAAKTLLAGKQLLHARHAVEAALSRTIAEQHISNEVAHRPAEPLHERNRETHLVAPVQHELGQQVPDGFAEHALCVAALE